MSSFKFFVDPKCHPACFHYSALISNANVVSMAFISSSNSLTKYSAKAKDSTRQNTSHILSIQVSNLWAQLFSKDSISFQSVRFSPFGTKHLCVVMQNILMMVRTHVPIAFLCWASLRSLNVMRLGWFDFEQWQYICLFTILCLFFQSPRFLKNYWFVQHSF